MPDDHALRALTEARDQATSPVPDTLLVRLLAIEHAHAFGDDQDVALREIEAAIDSHLVAESAK